MQHLSLRLCPPSRPGSVLRHVPALVGALVGLSWGWLPPAWAGTPLNVVLIMADDLNCDLSCYAHPVVQSPNIDRLAARGTRFDRAYCQYPVCNPSRVSLLSGRRPATTQVIDNVTPAREHLRDTVFLPQYFRQHGYRTVKVGKIFHTGEEFEDPASWDIDIRELPTAKNPPAEHVTANRCGDGVVLGCDDSETWDGFVARRGVELLDESARGDRPFFLALGFRRPHRPYIAPRRYHDLYPASRIGPLIEPAGHAADIPRVSLTYQCGSERLSDADRPDVVGSYYASISFMDAQIGHVLDALDRARLWDRTAVIFVSDHGYHLGEHGGLWHKMTLFEPCARVPLVIAVPKQAPQTTSQLVELIDLYPTLCELCQLPRPAGLEGTSVVPLLRGVDQPLKPAALTVVSRGVDRINGKLDPQRMGRSVRSPRWRYTAWFDGSEELYDHEHDPHEYRNLADAPDTAAVIEVHRRLLADLEAQPPQRSVRVAGIVLKWIRGDKEANFNRAARMIREAAAHGAQLVCTTECFLDGYAIADKSIPLDVYRALGEPIPTGRYYVQLAALAKELKIHLLAGMLEADGDARFNTAVLIGPMGDLLGKYRKQKLGHEVERNTPGAGSQVFETPFGRLGVMICADRTEPDIVRRLREGRADFLLCPSGGMFGPVKNDPIVQARSRENQLPIVFVHPAEFLVTHPDGSIASRTLLGDTLLIADDEVGGARDQNQIAYFDLRPAAPP